MQWLAGSRTIASGTDTTCRLTATRWARWTRRRRSRAAGSTGTTGRRGRSCTRRPGPSTRTAATSAKHPRTDRSWWCRMCTRHTTRGTSAATTTITTTASPATPTGTPRTARPTATNLDTKQDCLTVSLFIGRWNLWLGSVKCMSHNNARFTTIL